jgi:hypothetical protein
MAVNFRNLQNGGIWEPGGTYTFEYYFSDITVALGGGVFETDVYDIADSLLVPAEPDIYTYGILFSSVGDDTSGIIDTTTYGAYFTLDSTGDAGWKTGTIVVPLDIPVGTYYLKHAHCHWTGELG